MMGKYSDWLRIDLHIHTDKSKETKENDYKGVFSVDQLKDKMIENGVGIFSLTDHNIINVDAYKEYYAKYSDGDPLLLLGVELDIQGPSALFHSLLIFNYNDETKAIQIADRLEKKYDELGITDPFKRVLNFEHIIDLFKTDDFFFIPHADSHRNIVKAYKQDMKDAQKMVLLMQSALEKVTKEETKEAYNKGFSQLLTTSFKLQHDIPYINFSDNHRIEQYPCRHMGGKGDHVFDYIKGDKSFESLRLAFVDPKSRIMSQEQFDRIDRTIHRLDKLKIESQSMLEDTELFFSPHLNTIIGGRSSGKSLLMCLLGNKIKKISANKSYEVDLEQIQIQTNLDSEYKQAITLQSDVAYINQGDIVSYFEEKDLKKLAEKSGHLDEYHTVKRAFVEHKNYLHQQVRKLIEQYQIVYETGEKKYVLHNQTINNILNENFVIQLKTSELQRNSDKSNDLNDAFELIQDLEENLTSFQSRIFKLTVEDYETIHEFESLLEAKKSLIQSEIIKNSRKKIFIEKVDQIIRAKQDLLNQEATQKIASKQLLQTLKTDIREHFKKAFDLKKSVTEIEAFEYSKKEYIQINEQVQLIMEVEQEESIHNILIEAFNTRNETDGLYLHLLKLLNKEITIKSFPNDNSHNSLSKKFQTQMEYIYEKLDLPQDYLDYGSGKTSKNNSPGFNSEKYLEIILKAPTTKIIIIDQPEDNLGNRFISDELVSIFRKIKFDKQLFLVTHNPSIVVYGDAECVILAENDGIIKYKQITLENKDAQKEICSVLDGGEYIFDNRSKKYNIQRILRG